MAYDFIQRRQWHPTPVLLPGKSHGRRSLVGCSPWGLEESDMTERLHFHFSLLCIGEGNGNPLQCSCLENPRDGVAQSWTRLKWLSSSSMIFRIPRKKGGRIFTTFDQALDKKHFWIISYWVVVFFNVVIYPVRILFRSFVFTFINKRCAFCFAFRRLSDLGIKTIFMSWSWSDYMLHSLLSFETLDGDYFLIERDCTLRRLFS